MRCIIHVLTSLTILAAPAYAETLSVSSYDPVFCGILSRHLPDQDVNYSPAREAVIPADINLNPMNFSGDIVIPLNIELSEFFKLPVQEGVELKPEPGFFRISNDGRVFWNGRELTDEAAVYCGLRRGSLSSEDILREEPQAPPQQLLDESNQSLYGSYPE